MNPFLSRIRRLHRRLLSLSRERVCGHACAIISSAPEVLRSAHMSYPYRQDSDFWYLTGSELKYLTLVVSSRHEQPWLLAPQSQRKGDYAQAVASLAAQLGATELWYKDLLATSRELLRGSQSLFFQNTLTSSWKIAQSLLEARRPRVPTLPRQFMLIDILLAPMRLIKDGHEIRRIKESLACLPGAYRNILPLIRAGTSELEIVHTIQASLAAQGATTSFPPIVAAGAGSAVPHYVARAKTLRRGEMLLVDCGAEYQMYASDITRMFPVSGHFSPQQAALYDLIDTAISTGVASLRPGVTMPAVESKIEAELTEGLCRLGILRGARQKLIRERAIKAFLPHSIGHSLGIDVHDVESLYHQDATPLAPGMVVTVEPGLYFSRPTTSRRALIGTIPRCGYRLEEDVLITKTGATVLSAGVPRERGAIEALLARAKNSPL